MGKEPRRVLVERLVLRMRLLPSAVGHPPRLDTVAPSLKLHYKAFSTTTGSSAPVSCFGNLVLTGGDLTSRTDLLVNTSYLFADSAVWIRDPFAHATNFSYSPLDDQAQTIYALGGITTFTYDGDRNLISVTDARGGKTSYSYDKMDRMSGRTDHLGATESYNHARATCSSCRARRR